MHLSQLRNPYWQLLVGVLLRTVHQNAPGTVHGFHCEVPAINLSEVHIVFVVVPVARLLPERTVKEDGGLYLLVASGLMFTAPVINQCSDQAHPFGVKERKPRRFLVKTEYCLLYTSPSPRDGLLSRM